MSKQIPLEDRWIGRALRVLRVEQDVEQQEIASQCGWSGSHVSHVEAARVNIRARDVDAYAQALGLTVSDVLSRARELQYRLGNSDGTRRSGDMPHSRAPRRAVSGDGDSGRPSHLDLVDRGFSDDLEHLNFDHAHLVRRVEQLLRASVDRYRAGSLLGHSPDFVRPRAVPHRT